MLIKFTPNTCAGLQALPRKQDPALIGGAIAAGASLLGNLFGSKNQSSANATNLKIAQMNNEFNERMLDKQIEYNWDMWNANNEYNTAAAQRQRYEDAGLNPYMMMNGGNSGIAQGGNAVTPPTAQAVQVEAYKPNFQGVADAAMQVAEYEARKKGIDAENRSKVAQAQKDEIDAAFAEQIARLNLENLLWQKEGSKEDWHSKSLNNQFALRSFDARMQDILLSNMLKDANVSESINRSDLLKAQKALADEQCKWVAPQALAHIATEASIQKLNYALGGKARAEAVESMTRTIESEERTNGLRFENKGKALDWKLRKVAEDILEQNAIQSAHADLWESTMRNMESEQDYKASKDNSDVRQGFTFIKRIFPSFGFIK